MLRVLSLKASPDQLNQIGEGGPRAKQLEAGAEAPKKRSPAEDRARAAALDAKIKSREQDRLEAIGARADILMRGGGETDADPLDEEAAADLLHETGAANVINKELEKIFAQNPQTNAVLEKIKFAEALAQSTPENNAIWTDLRSAYKELNQAALHAAGSSPLLRRAHAMLGAMDANGVSPRSRLNETRTRALQKQLFEISSKKDALSNARRKAILEAMSRVATEVHVASGNASPKRESRAFVPLAPKETVRPNLAGRIAEQRMARRTKFQEELDAAPEVSNDILEDLSDDLFEIPSAKQEAVRSLSPEEKFQRRGELLPENVENIRSRSDQQRTTLVQENPSLLPELPVNAPRAEIEAAQRQMIDGFASQAKTALRKEYLLKQGLVGAEGDAERARLFASQGKTALLNAERARTEAAIAEAQRAADANLTLEFFAEHENPRAAQMHYNQMRQERVALLGDAEAQRVLKALNEMRGDSTWENGASITPEMIQQLSPMDRDLGLRWHGVEKAQGELAGGVSRLREHHETRVQLTEMQTNAILEGNWASDTLRAALKPTARGIVNLENATDQVFTDLRRFDEPKTTSEKAVAAILNFKLLGGNPGRALLGVFGRKYANKSLNEAAAKIEPVQKAMRAADSERNLGKGIVINQSNVDLGTASNLFRGSFSGGTGATEGSSVSGRRAERGDVAISPEAADDFDRIMNEAGRIAASINVHNARGMSLQAAETLVRDLEDTLSQYTNTPTARSRAYDQALEGLRKVRAEMRRLTPQIGLRPPETEVDIPTEIGEAEEEFETLSQDLLEPLNEDSAIIEISSEDFESLDTALEARPNKLSIEQLDMIDRATDALLSSTEILNKTRLKNDAVGESFIQSLRTFIRDREKTYKGLCDAGLDKNPAADDLAQALAKTRFALVTYMNRMERQIGSSRKTNQENSASQKPTVKEGSSKDQSPETLLREARAINRALDQLNKTLREAAKRGEPLNNRIMDTVVTPQMNQARKLHEALQRQASVSRSAEAGALAAILAETTIAYDAAVTENYYHKDLEAIKKAGGLDTVREWVMNKAPVWIKRTDGSWSEGLCVSIDGDMAGTETMVVWEGPNRKALSKSVSTLDLLNWQKEQH